ncbi:hypothetical protein [Halanaerobacter jeridensis]|uniref:Type II secretory pathway component PulC n=1 Tax=Halanaerobacter jeridensis TaxID=706427 RepID=A0A938XU10_9FIRM|nr:hypothetical protein [Halanaerobacter jeridensis]MBM7557523.1 type II secretory pathway component PulC [Halanaerobacter jeridensis]
MAGGLAELIEVGGVMSLKLLTAIKYLLILILVFNCFQFLNLSYQLVVTAVTTPEIEINLETIKEELNDVKAAKQGPAVVKRRSSWPELKRDNLFATVSSSSSSTRVGSLNFVLRATSVFNNQAKNLAVLEVKETGQSYLLKVGEEIEGYQVLEIKSQELILAGPKGKVAIPLQPKVEGGVGIR